MGRYLFICVSTKIDNENALLYGMAKRDYVVESELSGINIENRDDAIKFLNKCIADCILRSIRHDP